MSGKLKMASVSTYDALQMHQHNRNLIFNLFRSKEVLSRAELTHITGMSPTSVGKIIAALEEDELLLKTGVDEEGLGRKAILYCINSEGRYVIGVDIDHHVIKAGLVNLCGEIKAKVVRENVETEDVPKTGRVISEMLSELLEGIPDKIYKKITGIGISIPGIVKWSENVIASSPQLGWKNVDLKKYLDIKLDVPIFVENDVKAEAVAEILFGIGRETKDMYIVKFGSGIGSALVLDNRVIRGNDNIFGEIGHLLLVPGGKKCECGRRGCIEAYCGRLCMEQEMNMPFEEILKKANEGDKQCIKLLEQSTTYLAMLLSNAVNIYNPPVIILYGDLLEQWPGLFDKLVENYHELLWKPDSMVTEIRKSGFEEEDISVLGAASVVLGMSCYHV